MDTLRRFKQLFSNGMEFITRKPTIDEELCEAFGLDLTCLEDEQTPSLNWCYQRVNLISYQRLNLITLKSGYLTAQSGVKLDLWQIRNTGNRLRKKFDLSVSEAESWIQEQQELYEKGFDFYFY